MRKFSTAQQRAMQFALTEGYVGPGCDPMKRANTFIKTTITNKTCQSLVKLGVLQRVEDLLGHPNYHLTYLGLKLS